MEFSIANQYLGLLQNSTSSQLLTFKSQLIIIGITTIIGKLREQRSSKTLINL